MKKPMTIKMEQKSNKCPCYKCDDRSPACHGTCEDYKAWASYNKKIRDAIKKDRQAEIFTKDAVSRCAKYRRKRG